MLVCAAYSDSFALSLFRSFAPSLFRSFFPSLLRCFAVSLFRCFAISQRWLEEKMPPITHMGQSLLCS